MTGARYDLGAVKREPDATRADSRTRKGGGGVSGRVGRGARASLVLVLGTVAAVLMGEATLRVFALVRPSVLFTRPETGVVERIRAARYPAGTVRFGFPVNRGGHYDHEFLPRREGRRVVASIGDSFSAGVVHHMFHFTTVAEGLLDGVDVYNYGLPAIDLPEYLHILVTEVLPADPDLIVVNVFVGNDLSRPVPPVTRPSMLERWLDPENLLVVQLPRRLLALAAQSRRARRALEDRDGRGAEAVRLHTRADVLKRYPWYEDIDREPTTLDMWSFISIERDRAARLCRQPPHEFETRLEWLARMRSAARGTMLGVMIIPDMFQVDDGLWAEIAPDDCDDVGRVASVQITRQWLEENGFPYVDLLPLLRGVKPLEDGERHLYKLTDTHFNARGNRVAGEALARFIETLEEDGGSGR